MYAIRIASDAMSAIERASRWWRRNRRASPRLFDLELNAAFDLLEVQPEIGTEAVHPHHGDVRVIRLRRSRYRITYQVHDATEQVWIVEVRHASKRPLRARRPPS